jgi:hypothetical protein
MFTRYPCRFPSESNHSPPKLDTRSVIRKDLMCGLGYRKKSGVRSSLRVGTLVGRDSVHPTTPNIPNRRHASKRSTSGTFTETGGMNPRTRIVAPPLKSFAAASVTGGVVPNRVPGFCPFVETENVASIDVRRYRPNTRAQCCFVTAVCWFRVTSCRRPPVNYMSAE